VRSSSTSTSTPKTHAHPRLVVEPRAQGPGCGRRARAAILAGPFKLIRKRPTLHRSMGVPCRGARNRRQSPRGESAGRKPMIGFIAVECPEAPRNLCGTPGLRVPPEKPTSALHDAGRRVPQARASSADEKLDCHWGRIVFRLRNANKRGLAEGRFGSGGRPPIVLDRHPEARRSFFPCSRFENIFLERNPIGVPRNSRSPAGR